ncbi:40S ribosomal protein S15-4-like [Hibiscus syriacus]|uniref:40S ribosomal protein S15-4-like n=1 Tax=Hibiscus syriacus TaxID=106335 RepID=UPI001924CF0F|nr:40S ribosomal protein S15-4-like [Hibiscus syriacus]
MKTEGKPHLIKKLADVKCQRLLLRFLAALSRFFSSAILHKEGLDGSVVPGLEEAAQVEHLLAEPNSEHVSVDEVLCFGMENLEKHLKMEDFFSYALDYSWKINCEASRIFDKYTMMDLSHPIQCTSIYMEEIHANEQRPYAEPTSMADVDADVAAPGVPKTRTFKKFSFRGVDLDALLDMSTDELVKLFPARACGRFQRVLKRKPMALIKKLCKKREAPPGEKPEPVRMHLRNMIIVPEMIGIIIGVYKGKTFNQVEIKPEMISHYLVEFSISYKLVKHERHGIGATHSSRFIPLK